MCIKLETLKDSELFKLFEYAEESNVNDSLYLRCCDELSDVTGSKEDVHNAAIELSREKWAEAMDKHEKIRFLRDVHFDWLRNHDYE